MKISKSGLEIIKEFEGFRSKPYLCSAGVATIGYGTTVYSNGTKVRLSDKPISVEEATDMLQYQCDRVYGHCVSGKAISSTQNQFDAMVSFTYNVGCGAFGSSTLLRKHNARDYKGAADEFLRWNKAGGKILNGLVRRRDAERKLYLT